MQKGVDFPPEMVYNLDRERKRGTPKMKKIHYASNTPNAPVGYNKGETVEYKVGFTLTGIASERNNRPASEGGDVGDIQVKSPKASLTGKDNCKGYAFGFADTDFFFLMSIAEFEEFVNEFSYTDYDSHSHKAKLRIKNDSRKMREWLEARA